MIRGYLTISQRNTMLALAMMLCLQVIGTLEVHAQTTGTIYGTVSDPSGAVISGATVTVQNQETNLRRTVTTDDEGSYNLALLPVGKYVISASAQGFTPGLGSRLDLQVQENLRVDLKLEVGGVAERVSVTDETPQIDTRSVTLGKVVEARRIVDLPLNGRNFLQLGVLQAGVVPPPTGINATGSGTNNTPGGTAFNFSVNGMRISSNNHLLDGLSNVEPVTGAAIIVPSPDTLQEFRILTNAYSAEFGRAGGSIVTVITKSGSNQFHGSAYEFLRDDAFDARNFFAPDVPALKQHQFGATFGGLIIKDRTFFFSSYEGFRQTKGRATTTTVPSLLLRQGNFSQSQIKPLDPRTGLRFPGDIIPQSRFDPVSRKVLALYPEPNLGSDLWTGAPVGTNNRSQFMARIDHTLIDGKNNLTGRYFYDAGSSLSPNGAFAQVQGTIAVPGFAFEDKNRFQNLLLADTHIFSPNVINEFRFAYTRAKVGSGNSVGARKPSDLGFTYPVTTSIVADPLIGISGFSALGYPILGNSRLNKFYDFVDTVAFSTGKHSFKLGGEVRHSKVFSVFPSIASGTFDFNGLITGNAFADFLLGNPFNFFQAGGKEDKTLEQTAYYFYGQDDFQIGRNVTLNLGLRYELVPGFTEKDDALFTLVPGQQSTVGSTLPRGLVRPGDAGIPQTLFPTDKNNLAPRLGIAWDPKGDGKMSIRAGYGVFYDDSSLVQTFTLQQPPDVQGFGFSFFPGSFAPGSFADPYAGNSPFKPPLIFPLPVIPGLPVTFVASDLTLARIQHWNVTVQRQLTDSMAVEVAYVGNRGSSLGGNIDPNQAVITPTATRNNASDRRPFPAIGSAFQITSIFHSNYNGLQATLTRRLNSGLSFQAAYTWSKAIDDVSLPSTFFNAPGQPADIQNSGNLAAERGLSAFDVRHRFVTSYIYELPFFRSGKGAASYLLGGWKLSGIAALQSGSPFTVLDSSDQSFDGVNGDRPNLLKDPNLSSGRTPQRWFDTTAFQRVNGPGYGSAGRNIVFSDGIINFDMGLAKDFKLGEQRRLEFRWEVFNVFNHTNFGVPVNNFNSPTFGQIFNTSTTERQMQFALKFLF